MITSLHNPRIKQAVHLREARQRRKLGMFIIDGAREIFRAWQSGIELVEVFYCNELCTSAEARQLLEQLVPVSRTPRPELLAVADQVFSKIAFGDRNDGIIAIARTPQRQLQDLKLHDAAAPVCVIAGVEKPGNVGAVLRSADGAGIAGVVVANAATDLYNPNTIRASLGTIFRLPYCAADERATLDWLGSHNRVIYAAWVDASLDYTAADFTQPCAIVLGSEATGLSPLWKSQNCVPIKLPMLGIADSLNVSTAAAILFYEALRQRTRNS